MKVKGLRWVIVSLVGVATVINYLDRNALAVMWPGIAADLNLGKEDYALILSFFMVAYAIGQSAFGKIFDSLGTRVGFIISILIWSTSIALHAVAKSVTSFGIFRFTLGFGEAGNWPGATKSNAEWFPINERAFAQGIFNTGAALGAVIAAPLIAYLYLTIGWQTTFLVIAGLGFLWVIPWMILYKAPPATHPWLSEEERQHILAGQNLNRTDITPETVTEERAPGWLEMLTYRQSWAVILSRFFLDPVWWLFVSWLPIYLADQFGFDVKQIGMFGWVPYVGAAIGSLFGGWLAGYWIRRGWPVGKARKYTITLGGIIMFPALVLTAFAATPLAAVLLIAVILFGFQIAINNIQTLPSDFFSGKGVGSLAGIGGTAAVTGTLITTWMVPAITKTSYVPFFALGAILVPAAILAIWILGGKIQPITVKNKKQVVTN